MLLLSKSEQVNSLSNIQMMAVVFCVTNHQGTSSSAARVTFALKVLTVCVKAFYLDTITHVWFELLGNIRWKRETCTHILTSDCEDVAVCFFFFDKPNLTSPSPDCVNRSALGYGVGTERSVHVIDWCLGTVYTKCYPSSHVACFQT